MNESVPVFGKNVGKSLQGKPFTVVRDNNFLARYYRTSNDLRERRWIEDKLLANGYVLRNGNLVCQQDEEYKEKVAKAQARLRVSVRNLGGYLIENPEIIGGASTPTILLSGLRLKLELNPCNIFIHPRTNSIMYVVNNKHYHASQYGIKVTGIDTTGCDTTGNWDYYRITDFELVRR